MIDQETLQTVLAALDEAQPATVEIARHVVAQLGDANVRPDDCIPLAVTRKLASVEPEQVRWLWPGRIPQGKLTLLAGDPGLGKSFVTLDLAARVSRGRSWPDRPGKPVDAPGGVILLTAEDDLGDTVRPRLDAAGADVSKITALEGARHFDPDEGWRETWLNLSGDIEALREAILDTPDCRLVIVDPISAYLGRVDSHKNAELRGLLGPLAALAAAHDVAIVCVTHLRKSDGPSMYRTMGSLAFVAAARAVLAVAPDKDDPADERRFVLPIKQNLSRQPTGLAYKLDDAASINGQPIVRWSADPVTVTADEALAPPQQKPGPEAYARDEAEAWLRDALKDGPRAAGELQREAQRDGIAKRTLQDARAAMGAIARKEGFGGRWIWELPGQE